MKVFFILLCLFLYTNAFALTANDTDAEKHFQAGLQHLKTAQYLKAIAEFTEAISENPSYGAAYFNRAVAKDLLGKKKGFQSSELCYDLMEAYRLGFEQAMGMLMEICSAECFTLKMAFQDPEMVFCADFSSSRLTSFPEGCGNLSVLLHLNLYDNNLQEIGGEITKFPYLLSLNIASNRITSIQTGLSSLTWLRELNLSSNQLQRLPSSICQLYRLKTLNLRNNNLLALHPDVGNLQQLEVLDLALNQLNKLPAGIYKLKNLKQLILVGNPLQKSEVQQLQKALSNTKIYFD